MINWTWQDTFDVMTTILVHGFVPRHSSGSRYKYHHLVNSNVNSKMKVREHMMSLIPIA